MTVVSRSELCSRPWKYRKPILCPLPRRLRTPQGSLPVRVRTLGGLGLPWNILRPIERSWIGTHRVDIEKGKHKGGSPGVRRSLLYERVWRIPWNIVGKLVASGNSSVPLTDYLGQDCMGTIIKPQQDMFQPAIQQK